MFKNVVYLMLLHFSLQFKQLAFNMYILHGHY